MKETRMPLASKWFKSTTWGNYVCYSEVNYRLHCELLIKHVSYLLSPLRPRVLWDAMRRGSGNIARMADMVAGATASVADITSSQLKLLMFCIVTGCLNAVSFFAMSPFWNNNFHIYGDLSRSHNLQHEYFLSVIN